MTGDLNSPKVSRAVGLLLPNQGKLALVALEAVEVVQVLPEALFRLMDKSTLPLFPLPGFAKVTVVLPDDIVPPPEITDSHAAKLPL